MGKEQVLSEKQPPERGAASPASPEPQRSEHQTRPLVAGALRLGPCTISPPVLLAPMAGYTNWAFRQLVRGLGGVGGDYGDGLRPRAGRTDTARRAPARAALGGGRGAAPGGGPALGRRGGRAGRGRRLGGRTFEAECDRSELRLPCAHDSGTRGRGCCAAGRAGVDRPDCRGGGPSRGAGAGEWKDSAGCVQPADQRPGGGPNDQTGRRQRWPERSNRPAPAG